MGFEFLEVLELCLLWVFFFEFSSLDLDKDNLLWVYVDLC